MFLSNFLNFGFGVWTVDQCLMIWISPFTWLCYTQYWRLVFSLVSAYTWSWNGQSLTWLLQDPVNLWHALTQPYSFYILHAGNFWMDHRWSKSPMLCVMCVMFVFSSLYLDRPSAFCGEAINDKDVILKWLCSESKFGIGCGMIVPVLFCKWGWSVVLVVFTQWLLAGIYVSRLYSHHFGRSVDYLLPSFDVWSDLWAFVTTMAITMLYVRYCVPCSGLQS